MNCKEGKKNSTSWSRPVARCSELSRKLCFFCNRETRFVEEQKEGECAYSALLQLFGTLPRFWGFVVWNSLKFSWSLSMNEASYFPHPWIYYSNNTFYNELSLAARKSITFSFSKPQHWDSPTSSPWRSIIKQTSLVREAAFYSIALVLVENVILGSEHAF